MIATNTVRIILQSIGTIWIIGSMLVIWLPVIVHLWLPDTWVPSGFPAIPLEMLPNWLMWLPIPGINASLIVLSFANALLAIPGVTLFMVGEKISNSE